MRCDVVWCFVFISKKKKKNIHWHSKHNLFFLFFAHHLAPKNKFSLSTVLPFRSIGLNKYTYVCIRSTFNYWGKRNGNYGGLEFKTIEVIPQNAQLCFWYGPGWWSARGVKRLDVGTVKHPAPLRLLVCSNNQTKKKKDSKKDTTNVTNDKKQKKKKTKTKSATDTIVGSTTARKKRKVTA